MDNNTAKDFLEDLQIERDQLIRDNTWLTGQVDLLMQVKIAAQALVDYIHNEHNRTSSTGFNDKYQNVIDALNHYYNPNGDIR